MKNNPARRAAMKAQIERVDYCEACGREATVVHHLHNHGMGMKDDSPDNLCSMCEICHRQLHDQGKVTFWKRRGMEPR